VTLICPKLF